MMEGSQESYECYNDEYYTDDYGDGCDWYAENADSCGDYDSEGEVWTAEVACCACGGGSYEEPDVAWVGYLMNPWDPTDLDAYLWLDDAEMTEVYYWNIEDEAYCVLIPDWKDGNSTEGEIWGFFVTDPEGMCPYVD